MADGGDPGDERRVRGIRERGLDAGDRGVRPLAEQAAQVRDARSRAVGLEDVLRPESVDRDEEERRPLAPAQGGEGRGQANGQR